MRHRIYLFHLVQRFVALPIDLDIIMYVGCHDFNDRWGFEEQTKNGFRSVRKPSDIRGRTGLPCRTGPG